MSTFMSALLNTLMCMGTVFCVLIVISLIISLFKYIPSLERKMKNFSVRRKNKASQGQQSHNDPEKAPKRPILEKEEELVDDGELVAVIMAAIVASSGGAVSADRLVVRSIKRVRNRR